MKSKLAGTPGFAPGIPGIEDAVREYLRSNPDFLLRSMDDLSEIFVPHLAGADTASLLEKQIQLLRNRCHALSTQMDSFQSALAECRALALRNSAVLYAVAESDCLAAPMRLLRQHLREDYGAHSFRLFAFRDALPLQSINDLIFADRRHKIRDLFALLFGRQRSLCDSLQEEHKTALFGAAGGLINSTVLIPFAFRKWDGLLTVGSETRDRYTHGFAVQLLGQLAGFIGMKLDTWYRRG